MRLGVGTANLNPIFNDDYWKIFSYAIKNDFYIHTALNYENTEQYFSRAYSEGLKINKIIVKLEINKNPVKKIINIPKQINYILEKFKLESIDSIQICNNPNANKLNLLILKPILLRFKKKGIVRNFYLESFETYSSNLNKLINDNFFEGYLFTLNSLQRGANRKFFNNIISSKKKIISISPLASGNSLNFLNKLDIKYREQIEGIISHYNLENINALNIAFLKSIKNLETGIFGSKKIDKIMKINNLIKDIKPLSDKDFQKVVNLQFIR